MASETTSKPGSLVYILSSWKAWLVRRKPIRKLMHEIVIFENSLKQDEDQELYQIYLEESRNSFKLGILLPIACLACGVNEVTTFIINFMDWKEKEAQGLESGRSLIFPEWFPYYNDKYFNAYYFYQVTAVFFCAQYISCSDAPIVSLIMFASVRFRVLGRRMETFFKNGEKDTIKNMVRLRKLILEHKDIIRYIMDLNKNLKWFFFINLSIKSYHVTIILFNIFEVSGVPLMELILNGIQITILFLLVSISCFQANKITFMGEQLCTKIYNSDWIGQPSNITKSLLIMMIRTKKELKLECFGIVTLSNVLLVKIFQAGYTYVILNLTRTA